LSFKSLQEVRLQVDKDRMREKSENRLSSVFQYLRQDNYLKAKLSLDSLYSLAIAEEDSFLVSVVLGNLGLIEYREADYAQSILYYEESLSIDELLSDSVAIVAKLKSIGICYRQQAQYELALSYYNSALSISNQFGLRAEEASIANSIGNLYNSLDEHEEALTYFSDAQKSWEELNDSLRSSYVLGNIGNALLGLGNIDDAISSYEESLKIKYLVANENSIAITLGNLGEAHFKKKNFEMSKKYYLESLAIRERNGLTNSVAIVCNNLALLEVEKANYDKAKAWLNRAQKIANETASQDITLENLRIRKLFYKKTGEYKLALRVDSIYDGLRQEIFNDQILKVQKSKYDFDLSQKDIEQERIEARLNLAVVQGENQRIRSKIQEYVIFAILIVTIIVGYFAYRLQKKNNHIENLIRELHHRVKNHLGMISGMFGAQTDLSVADTAVLDEAKTRVEAVNGIHRRLYRQDEYEFVNMHEYLEELVDNNALVFGLFNKIDKRLDISANIMEIDKAISVGLIANEVLTNAFKYGLQDTQKPVLKIVLEKVLKGYRMIIFNNASADKSPGGGFGGELINRLAQNLKGQVQIAKEGGFQFELTFP